MAALGDWPGALALFENVVEVRTRTLPDDHPDLQTARMSLAAAKADLGDLRGARVLAQRVFEVLSRTLPDDHTDLQDARLILARTRAALGEPMGGEGIALMRAMIVALESSDVNRSHRELEGFATMQEKLLGCMLSQSLMREDEALRDLVFQAVETARSAAVTRERLFKKLVLPDAVAARVRELEERLAREAATTREVIFDERATPKAPRRDAKSFFALVQERDRLERELADLYLDQEASSGCRVPGRSARDRCRPCGR
jgi:Arc/MetJ family transcription regulator